MSRQSHSSADAPIITGCLRGDPAAQRTLYKRYYAYALTVCLAYAPHRAAAEEMVQDAFVRVFQRMDRFGGGNFKPWFRRVTVNCAIDHLRKHKENRVSAEEPLDAQLDTAANAALDRLSHAECLQLLARIPRSYRLVFNLFVLEEYTHAEIAKELGITVGTSKSNLSAARAHLRRLALDFFAVEKRKYV